MKKKIGYGLIAVVLIAFLVSLIPFNQNGTYDSGTTYYEYDDANYGDSFSVAEENSSEDASKMLFAESEDAKLVYTGSVTIGTDSIKKSYNALTESMKEYGAFFETVSESSSSKQMTIRIPKDEYMDFYESLSKIDGTITYSNINIQDKTKTYTDNTKRIDVLQSEYDELKALMDKADTVEDVITIRDRLSEVIYEMESLKNANDTIDYDSDYGTLTLEFMLNGTRDEASFWYQIKEAFSSGIYLLKSIVLGLVSIWWVILIGGYGIIAYIERWWPFGKKDSIE